MSRVISGTENYGNGAYIIPTDDDTGNSVFADLEVMFERLATHSHTGADSASISLNFTKIAENYIRGAALTWISIGDGLFRAVVNIDDPTPTYDANLRTLFYRSTATGFLWEVFAPRTEKITDSSYYVYSNDNQIDLRTVYY